MKDIRQLKQLRLERLDVEQSDEHSQTRHSHRRTTRTILAAADSSMLVHGADTALSSEMTAGVSRLDERTDALPNSGRASGWDGRPDVLMNSR